MKILVLNGSPHREGNTMFLVNAFKEGAESKGHEVEVEHVAALNVRGCLDCGYCRNQEKGVCVQQDDMQALIPRILAADMLVLASPIYYFTLSAQLHSVIQRTYSFDIPKHIKKAALLLSSGSPYVYGPAIAAYYHSIVEYWNVENAGIYTANKDANQSPEKRDELFRFGSSL